MTPAQTRFVELEKKKEEVKKYFDELSQLVEQIVRENGVNAMFQDGEGTVYKVVPNKGKWVDFDPYTYTRTRRLHEERSPSPLALKDAEAAGFTVPKK